MKYLRDENIWKVYNYKLRKSNGNMVVRHGQSVADLEDRHEGRADFQLTELGVCRQMCCRMDKEHYKIDVILSSPLKGLPKLLIYK